LVRNSEGKKNNQLVILDPGIVTSLSAGDMDNFKDVFRAVIYGDTGKVGELFLERSTHLCTNKDSFVKGEKRRGRDFTNSFQTEHVTLHQNQLPFETRC
jgi:predicted unusual protein kinase regulating ubiquinone biosynthesis (AarF/ABC1/UbiB family)